MKKKQGGGGGVGLTAREVEVAGMVADGLRSREIAARMGIAEKTVWVHRHNLYRKLGVRNGVELVRRLQSVRDTQDMQDMREGTGC